MSGLFTLSENVTQPTPHTKAKAINELRGTLALSGLRILRVSTVTQTANLKQNQTPKLSSLNCFPGNRNENLPYLYVGGVRHALNHV